MTNKTFSFTTLTFTFSFHRIDKLDLLFKIIIKFNNIYKNKKFKFRYLTKHLEYIYKLNI